jgi:hypothetical protein
MHVGEVRRGTRTDEGFIPIVQETNRGDVESRFYQAEANATRAVLFVGGAGGGWDTPVRGWLYPRLARQFQTDDAIHALRVRYRQANDLAECTLDVLAGIAFLQGEGVTDVALVGHSFGGAVVIQAAAASEAVTACVPMSTQTFGVAPAATLGPRCAMLMIHGTADEVLPPDCSRHVYAIAKEPKQILLKEGVRHGLDEWSDELPGLLRAWIVKALSGR